MLILLCYNNTERRERQFQLWELVNSSGYKKGKIRDIENKHFSYRAEGVGKDVEHGSLTQIITQGPSK